MPHGPPHQGTPIIPPPGLPPEAQLTPKQQCKIDGGVWDEATQTCLLTKKVEPVVEPPPKVDATGTEVFTDPATGRPTGITTPGGDSFLGITNLDDLARIKAQQEGKQARIEGLGAPVGTAQTTSDVLFRQQQQAQQLAQGVGQFNPLAIDPTGLDVAEGFTAGVIGAIPNALKLGATGAGVGLVGGGVVAGPIGAGAGAAIGAVAGFVGGLASSMIGNFKAQRSDTTTAQQRILDEGKQTMKDWATLAKTDPANKMFYLAEFNKQSAQIDQAYRQMKLDTSRDLAKFETALPNLAEFESFYSSGGERDTLDIEMRNSLLTPVSPEYEALELSFRRRE
ncbi:hypothetical protein KAR91_65720 [Candidatus Pacearchaeota archaeon]|nr:hypothetical protein [Candidatus Pacearchaeota archaeon]